jgi:hypothetical protein
MNTKDWQVVKDARAYAAKQLEFYEEMMWKKYIDQKVHEDMLNLYKAFDPNHHCELCKLKT